MIFKFIFLFLFVNFLSSTSSFLYAAQINMAQVQQSEEDQNMLEDRSSTDLTQEDLKIIESKKTLVERMKWFFEAHKGSDGYIPLHARSKALQQLRNNLNNGLLQPAQSGAWLAGYPLL